MRDLRFGNWMSRALMAFLFGTLTIQVNSAFGQGNSGLPLVLMERNGESEIGASVLPDAFFRDVDWVPILLRIDNHSRNQSGSFEVLIEIVNSSGIDPLFWRESFEVPAGQQLEKLIGVPITWDLYRVYQNQAQLRMTATRDGDSLVVANDRNRTSCSHWLGDRARSDGGTELVTLEVNAPWTQATSRMDWRSFTFQNVDLASRSGNTQVAFKNQIIGLDALPQNQQALLGVDLVLLHGIDPEDVSVGQRRAITEAVESGLLVLLRPDEKGRGLQWLPGGAPAPMVELDEEGKEQVRFPMAGSRVRKLSEDCSSVAQGLGHWLVLEKANGPWDLSSLVGLKHPWHLGSARARLEGGYPLLQLLETIDSRSRPGNPLRLILILGFCYVCVLWPFIGTYLKNRGRLPYMVWLQPLVAASCILLVFLVSTFRLGVLPRSETEALLVRFPGESHGVLYLIESSYTSMGGRSEFKSTSTLPVIPLRVGASTQNHTLTTTMDGRTQVSSDRKIRTTSNYVSCGVVEVVPSVRKVREGKDVIFEYDPYVVFAKLLESEPGTQAALASYKKGHMENVSFGERGDETKIECRGLERSNAGKIFDEAQLEKLGIDPGVKLTIFDASLELNEKDPR